MPSLRLAVGVLLALDRQFISFYRDQMPTLELHDTDIPHQSFGLSSAYERDRVT